MAPTNPSLPVTDIPPAGGKAKKGECIAFIFPTVTFIFTLPRPCLTRWRSPNLSLSYKVYLSSQFKREKRMIADSIVTDIKGLSGRFLKRNAKTGKWQLVDDSQAREKTLQALREKSKHYRAQLDEYQQEQEEQNGQSQDQEDHVSSSSGATKPAASVTAPPPCLAPYASHHHMQRHHHNPYAQPMPSYYPPPSAGYPPASEYPHNHMNMYPPHPSYFSLGYSHHLLPQNASAYPPPPQHQAEIAPAPTYAPPPPIPQLPPTTAAAYQASAVALPPPLGPDEMDTSSHTAEVHVPPAQQLTDSTTLGTTSGFSLGAPPSFYHSVINHKQENEETTHHPLRQQSLAAQQGQSNSQDPLAKVTNSATKPPEVVRTAANAATGISDANNAPAASGSNRGSTPSTPSCSAFLDSPGVTPSGIGLTPPHTAYPFAFYNGGLSTQAQAMPLSFQDALMSSPRVSSTRSPQSPPETAVMQELHTQWHRQSLPPGRRAFVAHAAAVANMSHMSLHPKGSVDATASEEKFALTSDIQTQQQQQQHEYNEIRGGEALAYSPLRRRRNTTEQREAPSSTMSPPPPNYQQHYHHHHYHHYPNSTATTPGDSIMASPGLLDLFAANYNTNAATATRQIPLPGATLSPRRLQQRTETEEVAVEEEKQRSNSEADQYQYYSNNSNCYYDDGTYPGCYNRAA